MECHPVRMLRRLQKCIRQCTQENPVENYGELWDPTELVEMVKTIYAGNQCAVVNSSGQTDWFTMASDVKQWCNMPGFLLLLVIDWIMRATVEGSNTGIRWMLCFKLDDLDFAGNIALISSTREQIHQKVRSLSTNSKRIGLKINPEKTKLLRLNTSNTEKVQVDGQDIEEVESFVYLGANVSNEGGTEGDMKARLGKARVAYNKLEKFWKNSQFTKFGLCACVQAKYCTIYNRSWLKIWLNCKKTLL